MKRYNIFVLPLFYLLDIFLEFFSFHFSYYIRFEKFLIDDPQYYEILYLTLFFWCLVSIFFATFEEKRGKSLAYNIRQLCFAKVILISILSLYIVGTKGYFISRKFLAIFFILDFVITFFMHVCRFYIISLYRKVGRNYKKVLLVESIKSNGHSVINGNKSHISYFSSGSGHKIIKSIGIDNISDVYNEIESQQYDLLVIGKPSKLGNDLMQVIEHAENQGLRVNVALDFVTSLKNKISISYIDKIPFISIRNEPLRYFYNRIIKRIFDLATVLFTFIFFFWWFYLLVGCIIKLTSKGPVVFKQKRTGINQKIFQCYKFRTMYCEYNHNEITRENDQRITLIGKFLRRTNLDELPQILNVFKGDMSIVGPRPYMVEEDMKIRKKIQNYMVRQFVKPGITGWAAINGHRGGTHDLYKMGTRTHYDIFYIEHWSIWFDIEIIFKTILQMLLFKIPNAY